MNYTHTFSDICMWITITNIHISFLLYHPLPILFTLMQPCTLINTNCDDGVIISLSNKSAINAVDGLWDDKLSTETVTS